MSLLLIDLPDKTVAHIRSDYGHGKGHYPLNNEDKKVVNDAIYNGMRLDDVKNSMIDGINKLETINMAAGVRVFKDDVIDAINDWYPAKQEGGSR